MERSRTQIFYLVCSVGGLQLIWSVINCNINVYLLSMGFPPAVTPLIWLAAPLCGTVVQPIVGHLSDSWHTRYGRRKPFIAMGTLMTVVCLNGLAWSSMFSRSFALFFSDYNQSEIEDRALQFLLVSTVFWVYALNVAVQPLQLGIRSFLIETCPRSQQSQISAWSSCVAGVGNILGYVISYTEPPTGFDSTFPYKFRYLTFIAAVCLVLSVLSTLFLADVEPMSKRDEWRPRIFRIASLWEGFRPENLSPEVRLINNVQFFSWMAWFPFLFYMTSFVTELGSHNNLSSVPDTGNTNIEPGALAGIIYASVSCAASLVFPVLLKKVVISPNLHVITDGEGKGFVQYKILNLYLHELWGLGLIFFSLLMFASVVVSDTLGGTALVGMAGIPWAISSWIPYALLGTAISSRNDDEDDVSLTKMATGATVGLHNAAISAPQILAALLSAAVIAIANALGSSDSFGWVLRIGGCASLYAAWLARRL